MWACDRKLRQITALRRDGIKFVDMFSQTMHNVSNSSLDYARQDKIPMILVYVSLAEPQCFYFVDLQSQIDDIDSRRKNEDQEVHTVHIPIDNYAENDLSGFFELIDSYYD